MNPITPARLNPAQEYVHPYSVKDVISAVSAIVPSFDGDPMTLSNFTRASETIINTYADRHNVGNIINTFLLDCIRNKIVGRAARLVGSRQVDTWGELRRLLDSSYQDQRSENSLMTDLMNVRPFRSDVPMRFGTRIKDVLCLLLNKIKSIEQNQDRLRMKTEMHEATALQVFLRGLMEFGALGDRVRYQNPATLEAAMAMVIEEENFLHACGRSTGLRVNNRELKSQNNHGRNFHTPPPPRTQGIQSRSFPTPNQRSQSNYRTQRPQSFRFAKSPGQMQDRRSNRATPMELGYTRSHGERSDPRPNAQRRATEEHINQQQIGNEPYYAEDDQDFRQEASNSQWTN